MPLPPTEVDFPKNGPLAFVDQVSRAAEFVRAFLKEFRNDRSPTRLSPATLLRLAAASRLDVWNRSGMRISPGYHLPVGASAMEDAVLAAIAEASVRPSHDDTDVYALLRGVIDCFLDRFVWSDQGDVDEFLSIANADERHLTPTIRALLSRFG